ncbi:Fe-S protein assembly co-chaperone HscB [archaeon]|nr:MAG: Fe-S protein assembly co-chaperone HscB [archaeon]
MDMGKLEASYKRLQKSVHPDKFGQRTQRERDISADASSQLNVAYRVLRSPSARAQYLLQRQGIDAIGEATGTTSTATELLMEIMEAREVLEDTSSSRETIRTMERQVDGVLTGLVRKLSAAFRAKDYAAAADLTVRLQYYTKLHNEIEDWFADAQAIGSTPPPS